MLELNVLFCHIQTKHNLNLLNRYLFLCYDWPIIIIRTYNYSIPIQFRSGNVNVAFDCSLEVLNLGIYFGYKMQASLI